jgi:glycosyltransferase involved in cell wall biosynthesis
VDDGSTDATWPSIQALCGETSVFTGISLTRNFGHQNAILAGLHHAGGDLVLTIDADLQDDGRAIEAMLDKYRQGFEVVYGVRRRRDTDGFLKRTTAGTFYRLLGHLGVRTIENHGDFRLMSRRAVNALLEFREVNLYLRGLVTLVGFRNCAVEYDRLPRTAGTTKYSPRKMVGLALSAITAFSDVPLRMITWGAFAGFLAVMGISGWVVWVRFFTERSVPGWTSIVLPMCFIGALNLLAVGVLGEYVARIFAEVKARPRFLVADATAPAEAGTTAPNTKGAGEYL